MPTLRRATAPTPRPLVYDGDAATASPVRIAAAPRRRCVGGAPVGVQVARDAASSATRSRRRDHRSTSSCRSSLLILIAGVLRVGRRRARTRAAAQRCSEAVAARSHLDLSPVDGGDVPGEVHPLLSADQRPDGAARRRADAPEPLHRRRGASAAHAGRGAEGAHRGGAARGRPGADATQSLAHLYTGVERMSRLVAQLLSLARNEPSDGAQASRSRRSTSRRLAFDVTTEWVPAGVPASDIDLGFEGSAEHAIDPRRRAAPDRAHQQPARQRDPLQPRRRPRDGARRHRARAARRR